MNGLIRNFLSNRLLSNHSDPLEDLWPTLWCKNMNVKQWKRGIFTNVGLPSRCTQCEWFGDLVFTKLHCQINQDSLLWNTSIVDKFASRLRFVVLPLFTEVTMIDLILQLCITFDSRILVFQGTTFERNDTIVWVIGPHPERLCSRTNKDLWTEKA